MIFKSCRNPFRRCFPSPPACGCLFPPAALPPPIPPPYRSNAPNQDGIRHQLQGFGPQGHRQLQGHRADGQPGQQRARRDHRGMPPALLPAGECWVVDFGGRRGRWQPSQPRLVPSIGLLSRRVSYPLPSAAPRLPSGTPLASIGGEISAYDGATGFLPRTDLGIATCGVRRPSDSSSHDGSSVTLSLSLSLFLSPLPPTPPGDPNPAK